MGSTQRADRFEQLYRALKKHYKPISPISDRKVLDHLLYACCLQDASYEAADEAFAKLQQAYFDSNEVRVTTVAELSESLTSLPQAAAAANRIKKSLQSMFESRYSFDIDDLKKSNLGKAVDEISAWQGVTKFVVSYVTQHAFGGHSIPVDDATLQVSHLLDLLTYSEIEKGILPGVERAIAKNKGIEFASLLHQFAADHAASYKHPAVVAVFKELGLTSKPKASPPPPPPPPKPAKPAAAKPAEIKPASKGAKTKAPIAEPAPVASSKTKKGVIAAPTKEPTSSKTTKKMAPPPPSKPAAKAASPARTSEEKKTKAKSPAPPKGKPADKPSSKKATSKKNEPVKPATKKGSAAAPSKGTAKRPAAAAKSPPKKLPVKPVTKKRTKPK